MQKHGKHNYQKIKMKTFLKILVFLKPYWKQLSLSIIFTFLFSIFSGASMYLSIPLFETIFNEHSQPELVATTPPKYKAVPNEIIDAKHYIERWLHDNVFSGSKESAILNICILLSIFYLFKNIFDYLQSYLMAFVEQRLIMDIRNKLYSHIQNLSLGYFTNEKVGNLISRITNDVNLINSGISASFVTLIKEPLLLFIFFMMAFTLSWKLTLLSLIVFPLILVVISGIGLRLHKQSGVMQAKMGDITSVIQETISNIKVVKAFTMEKFEASKFQSETNKYFKTILKMTRIRNLSSPITELLSIVAATIIIWFGGRQVLITGEMKAAEFLGFLLIIFQLMPSVKELSSVSNRLHEFSAAAKRIFEILDTRPAIRNAKNPIQISKFKKSIYFENVNFSYDARQGTENVEVLKNINLEVKKGEVIAIVGPSGSGKTTLIDLIPRFYDPTGGKIFIDGMELNQIDVPNLRKLIGIVTQETILFNDSVKNNIAYGLPETQMSAIKLAAKNANALQFIEEMPNGFETIIGERGVKLSGGQRQRLSIARVILKNPPIMVFDEATSSLDSESEKFVQESIERLMKNRTSLVIAHRLSTVRHADRIIVINKGKIVQIGKHAELLKNKKGLYHKLYDMQFQL